MKLKSFELIMNNFINSTSPESRQACLECCVNHEEFASAAKRHRVTRQGLRGLTMRVRAVHKKCLDIASKPRDSEPMFDLLIANFGDGRTSDQTRKACKAVFTSNRLVADVAKEFGLQIQSLKRTTDRLQAILATCIEVAECENA